MDKHEAIEEGNAVLFDSGTPKRHRLLDNMSKTDRNKLIEANVLLLESQMPHSDPIVQKRALKSISNLERQLRV